MKKQCRCKYCGVKTHGYNTICGQCHHKLIRIRKVQELARSIVELSKR